MMAEVVVDKKQTFLDGFIGQLNDAKNQKLEVIQEAKEALKTLDFPTTRDEYWKYTRVSSIINNTYLQEPSFSVIDVDKYKIEGLEVNLFVFVNGFLSETLSNIVENEKFKIKPLSIANQGNTKEYDKYFAKLADHRTQIFTALNTVYHTNGVSVLLKKNEQLKLPIHIMHLSDGEHIAFNPRNIFIGGASSKMQVIFTFDTLAGSSFSNIVSEVVAEENANISLYLYQNQNDSSKQINTTQVLQKSNSVFTISTITFNGGLVRNNVNVEVDGEGCTTNMYALYMPTGNQHVDNHTYVDHKKPNCQSNELYKGVLSDKSTGVFNGKVFVNKRAQKTNAYQANNNIVIGDHAKINSKPELEIYADDVKCSHGSTIGQLNKEAIYYLQSRGISAENARSMIVKAFAQDVIDHIDIEPLRNMIESELAKKFKVV